MTDFRVTVYSQAANDALRSEGWSDISSTQMNLILNGLDAAGLLLTPARLEAIAQRIEANKAGTDDRGECVALDCAAAIVRHSMPAVTT